MVKQRVQERVARFRRGRGEVQGRQVPVGVGAGPKVQCDPGVFGAGAAVTRVDQPGGIAAREESRVCARDTRRVDPSPPGLAQGDNLVCPGSPRSGSALRHKQRPQAALGLRTNPARMA